MEQEQAGDHAHGRCLAAALKSDDQLVELSIFRSEAHLKRVGCPVAAEGAPFVPVDDDLHPFAPRRLEVCVGRAAAERERRGVGVRGRSNAVDLMGRSPHEGFRRHGDEVFKPAFAGRLPSFSIGTAGKT